MHLTDGELAVVRNAMQMYLRSFGHNEAEVVEHAKQALAKLAAATREADDRDGADTAEPQGSSVPG